ncbi:tyrosine kinase receptor Cad96Ca [Fopius arisanus]|uniref:receptor protein-tyrosine kinase n=2 Tax=Fopius arisanus TaxID=64838 RepID=A0A9R1TPE8_9HYME|nr:PREDICTED: tyrosine kinase receptor Cad96Ca [Fopius arisanus]
MFVGWIVVETMVCLVLGIHGQFSENTPPIMYLNRNWVLDDNEPVGSIVERVRAEDNEQGELTYGLEQVSHNYNGDIGPQAPLPFSINNDTGTIFINETLKGRGGQNLFLYVTVSDGQLIAKTEVYVNIKDSTVPNVGLPVRIRPPIMGLPNIHVPRPLPSEISSGFRNDEKTTRLRPETRNPIDDRRIIPKKMSPVRGSSHEIETNGIEGENAIIGAKITSKENSATQDFAMTVVPVIAGCGLLLSVGIGIWTLRGKVCGSLHSKENSKEQTVRASTMTDDPSLILKNRQCPKFRNSKFTDFDKDQQISNNQQQDDAWEFPRHRLKVFSILGEGCFGQVWKSEATDIDGKSGPTIVAVKTLKENATEREHLDLTQELKVMKSLEPHPNVVRLIGCCTERAPIFVILEYVSGGKLQSFLRASREERNHGGPGLTSRDLTGFVYQIAKGMEYLASKGIIHRDLAARNVLIDENRACKVADFGFARDLAANQIYERKSEGRLPIRWMAPESLYDNIFSVKSDIWGFGVLIWEIVTLGSTPYPGMAAAEVMRKIKEGYRLDRPEHCKRELYNIMYYCWDKDPSCRPSFSELVGLAEGLLLDEIDYIELDRFPDHSYYNVLNLSGEKL